jgi:hypothetical protein
LQLARSLKSNVCDALRPLCGFRETYRLQDWDIVLSFFLQRGWKAKPGEQRLRWSTDLITDGSERNEELATSQRKYRHCYFLLLVQNLRLGDFPRFDVRPG